MTEEELDELQELYDADTANIAFIKAAEKAVPRLIARVKELEGEVQELKTLNNIISNEAFCLRRKYGLRLSAKGKY